MKNIFLRKFAVVVGLGSAIAAPAVAQDSINANVKQAMTDPAKADVLSSLWAFVQQQDKTEVYLAFLDACGDAAPCSAYAAEARRIVVERTANMTRLPDETVALTLIGDDNRPGAVYIG